MLLTKAAKRNIALFFAAFLLCGVLHILLYGVDFTFCIVQLYCGVLTILWAISVRKRVIDDRLRSLMLWVAVCLFMHFGLQLLRYDLFQGNINAQRYLWYAMYIPMTAQAVLCFLLAVFIHRPQHAPLLRRHYLLVGLGVVLVLGVLTNDLHFWFTSFPSGILDDNGQKVNGWLYYVIELFIYGTNAYAFAVMLKKSHRYVGRKYQLLPLVPLLILVIYMILYPFDIDHRFLPTRVWQIGEMHAFCIIATLEACIQTGLIPANRGYEILFSAADLPAVILDGNGKPVYQTTAAHCPFVENESTKVVTHPIRGGRVEYLVNMEQVKKLNRQIADASQQIETRNAYIAEENRIKQEQAELETRNRLYERVSSIVRPQIEKIDTLINTPEGCGDKELANVAVLQAYIKRRSNMELLAASGTLTAQELASAVAESLDYIRLCGANTTTRVYGTGSYPADMVIAAYEQIEEIMEDSLDTLSDMIVAIRSDAQRLIVRMMLKAENFSCETRGPWQDAGFSRKASITKEGQDMIIVLTFTEGGGLQ